MAIISWLKTSTGFAIMRFEYIDNLRAILMMLGVDLHSAAVFSIHKYWLVSYERTSTHLDWLTSSIHSFRMPLFFVIAGFFALMLLQRYKASKFMKNRSKRIVIPFISAVLLINPLQNMLMTIYYKETTVNYFVDYAISHLWFLVNLMGYCLILLLSGFLLRGVHMKSEIFMSSTKGFFAVVLAFPLFIIIVLTAGTLGLPIYEHVVLLGSPVTFMYYLSFFLFGAIIFAHKPWLELIETKIFMFLSLTGVALMIMNTLPRVIGVEPESVLSKVGREYIETISVLFICLFLWSSFAHLFKQSSKVMAYLAGASYTIYLLHHLLVVAFTMLINISGINAHPLLIFTCLVTLVFVTSLAIHKFVILRFSRLRFMFNGQ